MVRKTFVDSSGKRRHLTKWQQEVSQHGMKGAKKEYAGYRQGPPPASTTGHVRNVKGGTRRVKDTHVGRGKRSILTYKGDRVGTWTTSGGNTNKAGNTGLGWYMDRGYGTARKPVPKTKLTKRLGIAGAGKEAEQFEAGGIMVPGEVAGLNQEEEWEMRRHGRKAIRESEDEVFGDVGEGNNFGQMRAEDAYDAELTMWQKAVKEHGIPSGPRAKKHGHPAFKKYRGRKQVDGVMTHYGDKTSKWTKSGGYSTKGVNTGRGWFMERGMGTAKNPIPNTKLTRKLGIAGAGRQTRDKRGRFGRFKRILVPGSAGNWRV